ncbi:MAG: FtsH protease activity modulator HflK [Rhodospirillaceae bacterium]|nr:MAG: FtsH protease activity modulator HflK [Rhodospirillaceae bacterium]
MAWNNQGGPWGGGGSGGGSGGGGGQSPWGRGPSNGGRQSPDFDELLRRGQDRMRNIFPGGIGAPRSLAIIVLAAIVLWLLSGLYRVNPGEVGVNMVFGRYVSQTQPGLNWNWPAPVGSVATPDVATRNRVEIGFRASPGTGGDIDVAEESLMLTGDENIVDIQAVVLWRIDDVEKYLFDIRDPESSLNDSGASVKNATVKNAVEAAVREIIGQSTFEYAITEGRSQIEAKAEELAQGILDSYNSGIHIEQLSMQKSDAPQEVVDAFRDVQKAKADKVSLVNEAQAYFNQITQDAEGQATQIIRQSEGYKQEKVAGAQGDTQRFLSIYQQYQANPNVTERRMYLEALERIMANMNKVLVSDDGKSGTVPYLPLDQLLKSRAKPTQTNAAPATGNNSQQSVVQQGSQP